MNLFLKYKKIIIVLFLVLFLALSGGIYYFYSDYNSTEEQEEINIEINEPKEVQEEIETNEEVEIEEITVINEYYVDVKGAVNNPGVYKLTDSNIVNDAINAAGGLNKYADTKCINLSKKIHDEMVIYVYTKSETWNIINNKNKEDEVEEVICNDVKNDAYVTENNTEEQKTETKEEVSTLININSAQIEELTTLPGIGESKAKSVIEYRQSNGNFKTIDDLKNVTGIGDSIFEKIKSLITV